MNEPLPQKPQNALILLGCPQVPIQTSIALWLCAALKNSGIRCLVGGTPSARLLLEVADPERHYLTEVDAVFVLIHNQAAVAYAATMAEIAGGTTYALLFGEETESRLQEMEGISCQLVTAKGSHNPLPLKRKIQEVITAWDA